VPFVTTTGADRASIPAAVGPFRTWRPRNPRVGTLHVLVEAHDEWQTGDRRYRAEASMDLLTTPPTASTTELVAA
jgi:hypothetical protein